MRPVSLSDESLSDGDLDDLTWFEGGKRSTSANGNFAIVEESFLDDPESADDEIDELTKDFDVE